MDAESLFICVYLMDGVVVEARFADRVKAFAVVENHGRASDQAGSCPDKVVDLQCTRDDMVEDKIRMSMNGGEGSLTPTGRHRLIAVWVSMDNGPRISALYPRELMERQGVATKKACHYICYSFRLCLVEHLLQQFTKQDDRGVLLKGNGVTWNGYHDHSPVSVLAIVTRWAK